MTSAPVGGSTGGRSDAVAGRRRLGARVGELDVPFGIVGALVQPEDIQVRTKDGGPKGAVGACQAAAVRWATRVTIQLPDDISAALGDHWDDAPRRSLEAIAVDAYRTGALTEAQVRRLLGLETRLQVHALLKAHHVPPVHERRPRGRFPHTTRTRDSCRRDRSSWPIAAAARSFTSMTRW